MGFICFICKNAFEKWTHVVHHLKNYHFLRETSGVELKCVALTPCDKIFSTFSGLRRHSILCSNQTNCSDIPSITSYSSNCLLQDTNQTTNLHPQHEKESNYYPTHLSEIVTKCFSAIMGLQIPQSHTDVIFKSVSNLIKELFSDFKTFICNTVKNPIDAIIEAKENYLAMFLHKLQLSI